MIGVTDFALKTSFGAGTANHMKFGIITIRKSVKPEISKPNLYCFNTHDPLFTVKSPLQAFEIFLLLWGNAIAFARLLNGAVMRPCVQF